MSEPVLAFEQPPFMKKTFDDPYGRHALVLVDGAPDDEFRVDVNRVLPAGPSFHPTRLYDGYEPRHAISVADCNTSEGEDQQ